MCNKMCNAQNFVQQNFSLLPLSRIERLVFLSLFRFVGLANSAPIVTLSGDSLSIVNARHWSFQATRTGLMTRSDGRTSPFRHGVPVEVVNRQGRSASKDTRNGIRRKADAAHEVLEPRIGANRVARRVNG
jgi:hypothetical protein